MAELNKKDVQNNKEEVPFAHYEALFRDLDPDEAAQRCGVKYENGAFKRLDFPTPEFPVNAESLPEISARSSSMPSPVSALVTTT